MPEENRWLTHCIIQYNPLQFGPDANNNNNNNNNNSNNNIQNRKKKKKKKRKPRKSPAHDQTGNETRKPAKQ